MISNVAPNYHWGVTKNQFVFVLNLFCKEYSFGQVQFLYLVWVCVHFACRAKEHTHFLWQMSKLENSITGTQAMVGFCNFFESRCMGLKQEKNQQIWVFPKIGVPQNGWFITENPIRMDDLGVPLFLETSISTCWFSLWLRCELHIHLKFHHEVIKGTVTLKNSSGSSKEVNLGVGPLRLVHELIGMIWW